MVKINRDDDLRTFIQEWLLDNANTSLDESEELAEGLIKSLAEVDYEIK